MNYSTFFEISIEVENGPSFVLGPYISFEEAANILFEYADLITICKLKESINKDNFVYNATLKEMLYLKKTKSIQFVHDRVIERREFK